MFDRKKVHNEPARQNSLDQKAEIDQKEFAVESENDSRNDLDYSGSSKKTDPAEIALVKRLDWYAIGVGASVIPTCKWKSFCV